MDLFGQLLDAAAIQALTDFNIFLITELKFSLGSPNIGRLFFRTL